jgi:endonuclease-3
MAVTAQSRRRALDVARGLAELYPDAECALNFSSPLELLIATILSAQCTDERVNIVTRDLFKKYRSAADYADAPVEDLEAMIRSAGFYRMKAKNIQACCRALVERHGGEVPKDLAALVLLGGVGRKTANVVLGTAFGIPSGVVVDTHVTRLTNRLGLTKQTDAVKIEEQLISLLPPEEWIDFSHRLIWHGRKICSARKPLCEACRLNRLCPKNGLPRDKKLAPPPADAFPPSTGEESPRDLPAAKVPSSPKRKSGVVAGHGNVKTSKSSGPVSAANGSKNGRLKSAAKNAARSRR